LLKHPELVTNDNLKAQYFEDPYSGRAYKAITDLSAKKQQPDVVAVAEQLGGSAEDLDYVTTCWDNYHLSASNLDEFAKKLRAAYVHREQEGIARLFKFEMERGEPGAAERAIAALRALDTEGPKGIRHVRDILPNVLKRIDERANQTGQPSVKTGLVDLDAVIGGFLPGDYCILAARTSVGKTAFMLNLALNARVPVGIISAEQPESELTERMLSNLGSIKINRFRAGNLIQSDWDSMGGAVKKLSSREIYINDKSGPEIGEIEQTARKMEWENGIRILFIDYIQKIHSVKYKERYQQIGDISKRLFDLAKDLHIPIIALAQLNRNSDGKWPRKADLRESGDLEQDPDQIILLHKQDDQPNIMHVIVDKNRSGPCQIIDTVWHGEFMRVANKARGE
jgi:replicative DNA helicase